MSDFFYNLMHPLPNAVMTVIVGILALYWLFAFFSGAGMEDMDIGLDLDADVDIDADIDADADIDSDTDIGSKGYIDTADPDKEIHIDKEPGFFVKILGFLNLGKVPFMLILSTFLVIMWLGSLTTTAVLDATSWGLWSLVILIPISIAALFLTKMVTNPMVKIFRELGYRGEEAIDFLGRDGKMISTIKGEKIGTAEFIIDKNPIRLNVKSIDGEELRYGEYVIIADESEDKKIYYVSKEISIRNL